jgi:hypothetical protein
VEYKPYLKSVKILKEYVASETSITFKQTSRHYIPENKILNNHRCENIKT